MISPLKQFDTRFQMRNLSASILTTGINILYKHANTALIITVWISALLFGLYILTFYVASFGSEAMVKWNNHLPGLYQHDKIIGTLGVGIHFAAGGLILILGSFQLVGKIRIQYPKLHHWVGRFYITACILAAIGGLIFIIINGTIGGFIMDLGFSLYGILMLLSAIAAIHFARSRNFQKHQEWAMRLYSLAIGSWLYRMCYGFWALLADSAGHTSNFQGPFDYIMDFFFYLPGLLITEILIRRKSQDLSTGVKGLLSGLLLTATGFIAIGTYYFTLYYWGPGILAFIK